MDSSDRWIPDAASAGEPPADNGEPFFLEVGDGDEPAEPAEPVDVTEPAATAGQATEGAPDWFANKQTKQTKQAKQPKQPPKDKAARRRPGKKKAKKKSPVIVETEAEKEEELTWQEQLQRWAKGGEGKSLGVSAGVHLLVLLVLSVMLISGMEEEEVTTVASMSDEEVTDFEEIADTPIEMEIEVQRPEMTVLAAASALQPDVQLSASISDLLSGGTGKFEFAMPKSAVTKGSFSAWTVPEDPAPGENYLIIIQIKLPAKLRLPRYPLKDLSGKVVGTDGYEQKIPDEKLSEAGYLPIKGNQTQLTVTVPGAAKLVKDTIEIKSNLLKEQQMLSIEF